MGCGGGGRGGGGWGWGCGVAVAAALLAVAAAEAVSGGGGCCCCRTDYRPTFSHMFAASSVLDSPMVVPISLSYAPLVQECEEF